MRKIMSALLAASMVWAVCFCSLPQAKAAAITPDDVVNTAKGLVGKYPHYVWGGKSPSDGGFDCSGLVYYVFHTCLGSNVTYEEIWNRSAGTKIENKADFQPGDVLFGLNEKGGWHTGIYIGNNSMIHSGSSKGVSKTTTNGWFTVKFARRLTGTAQPPAGQQPPNGVYLLEPQCAPERRLDVAGAHTDIKTNIQIHEDNGSPAQQFELTARGDGYYSITAKVSGLCLDVQEGKTASGTNVWQYTPNATDAQKWKLEDAGDGYYYIIPKLNPGLCLDVSGGKNENGANVQVYNKNQTSAQKWKLIPLSSSRGSGNAVVQTDTFITVRNIGSDKMLNIKGNSSQSNANVTVYQADGTNGQRFKFIPNGSGGYEIEPECAPSCAINVRGETSKAGSNVTTWTKTGHSTQAWIVDFNSALSGYVIRSANNPDFVLTATGSANTSNVELGQYDPSSSYQVWTSDGFNIS